MDDIIVPELQNVDTTLIIDPDTRTIDAGSDFLLGVETDNDAERVKFQCPKIVGDNLDLSQYHIYIHYQNAKGEKGKYLCEDIEDGGENITFSWLLRQKAVLYKGQTKFLVCAKKTQEETIVWNTTLANGNVLEGLDVDEDIVQQNDDVIEQILLKLEQIEASGGIDEETLNQINRNTEDISKLSDEKADKDHTHTDYATKEDLNNVSVSEEQIESVVETYLEENPIEIDLSSKQDTLVSGTNIKTINGNSLLGSGNITIEGGSSGGSAKEWELITNITTEENVNSISVNVPKDCEEFYVYCKGLVADSNAGYISLKINDSGAGNVCSIVEVTGLLFNNNVRAVCFHVQRIGSFLKCEYSSSTLTINDGRANLGNQSIGVWKDFNEEIEFLSFVAYTSQFVTGFNMIVYGR